MKLIITEKRDMAEIVAKGLGFNNFNYIENRKIIKCDDNTYIGFGAGHLLESKLPDEKNLFFKTYNDIKLVPVQNKIIKGIDYLLAIKKIYNLNPTVIYNCCDSDREGQLIFDEISNYVRFNKKIIKRIWLSATDELSVKKSFDKPMDDNYPLLSDVAVARQLTDYNLNLNASSVLRCSVGRVMTPTINLITKRYLDNKNFKKGQFSYVPAILIKTPFGDKKLKLNVEPFIDKLKAQHYINTLEKVEMKYNVKTSIISYLPYYDTTSLILEAKKLSKYKNMSNEDVQSIFEKFYSMGVSTYPRTVTKFIASKDKIIASIPLAINSNILESGEYTPNNSKWINSKKIVGHEGITTTGKPYSGNDLELYNLILKRTVHTIFDNPQKLTLNINNDLLKDTIVISTINKLGYEILNNIKINTEEIQWINSMNNKAVDYEFTVLEIEAKAPSLYTEISLIKAMTNIANELEDSELAKKLKSEGGIGTPATRSSIISSLFKKEYIEKKKDKLVPTKKGLEIYEKTKSLIMGQPVISALMEQQLGLILDGTFSLNKYITWLEKVNYDSYNELKSIKINNSSELFTSTVNHFKGTISEDKFNYILDKDSGEQLLLSKEQKFYKIKLTKKDVNELFTQGFTAQKFKFKSNKGKDFECQLELGDIYKNKYINLKYKF